MAYFVKFLLFFFFKVLFMFQPPMEMKADLPWREVPGVFTTLSHGAAGWPLKGTEGRRTPGSRGAEGNRAGPVGPAPAMSVGLE